MFSKLKSVSKFSNETISLYDLYLLVKNNPQKPIIDEIRSVEKGPVYNKLKSQLNCITPHTIQSGLKSSDIIGLSGYLFYDIDGFDTKDELDDTINKLVSSFPISFLQRSVGGLGINFLIKVDDTNFQLDDTNFISVYNYVRELLISNGFIIDKYAGGISRKMNISSDNRCIFNNEVSFSIDKVSLLNHLGSSSKKSNNKRVGYITLDDTLELLPKEDLNIKTQITYDKDINGDYIIENMDYYSILIPKVIKDGFKHKLYTRIINGLYYINSSITRNEVYSYLYYLNTSAQPPMNLFRLKQLVNWLCNEIETTGEIRIKPRIKRIHFNEKSNLTKKEKQSMGAKVRNTEQRNKTIQQIIDARNLLWKSNEEPTQKKVCQITNLSIATVKRNWKMALEGDFIDINEVLDVKVEKEPEIKLDVIEEEDFWEGFSVTKRHTKGPEDEDFGDSDGIDGFIETIDI